jgi:methanogenic corrinoid protein MtbC1
MEPKRDQDDVAALAKAFAGALLAGDEVAADLAIRDAIAADLSAAEVNEQIIAPALWLIGDLWQRGEISVADEHLATEIVTRVLALQREARRVKSGRRGQRVVLAAPTGEMHVVALRMLASLLSESGYDAVMLGADVPAEALAAAVNRLQADVVCMSVTMAGGTDQALVAIHEVQKRRPRTGFVIGGRAVTSRMPRRPGIEVCARVSDCVECVDAIVNRAALN